MLRQTSDDESSSPSRQFSPSRQSTVGVSHSQARKLDLSRIESAAASSQFSIAAPTSLGDTVLPAIDEASSKQGRRKGSKQCSEFSGTPVSGKEHSIPLPARRWALSGDEVSSRLLASSQQGRRKGSKQSSEFSGTPVSGKEHSIPLPARIWTLSGDEVSRRLLADSEQTYRVSASINDEGEDTLIDGASKTGFLRGSGRRFSKESAGAGGQARCKAEGCSRHPSKESAGARGRANNEGSSRHPSKELVGSVKANTHTSVLHPGQEPAGSRGQAESNNEGPRDAVSSLATQWCRRPSKPSSQISRQEGTNSDILAYEFSNSSSLADRHPSKASAKAPWRDDVKSPDQAAASGVSGVMPPGVSVLASPRKARSRQASKEAVVVSDGYCWQAMPPIRHVPTRELAAILRDHTTEAPESLPGLCSQVTTEAHASSQVCDAVEKARTSPSVTPRAAVLSAKLLLSEVPLGGPSMDAPASVPARERWGHVRKLSLKIREMFAQKIEEHSVSPEVGLDDSVLTQPKSQEDTYWDRLWELGKLQRMHLTDEHSFDALAMPEEPTSLIEQT